MKSGQHLFSGPPKVMGILNLTPDSFSDAGQFLDSKKAEEHVLQMQEEGMELLDVGAESTRPGASEISSIEQLRRLEVFFEKTFPLLKVPVSIDTRNPEVAEFCVKAGVFMVNDVSGLSFETEKMLGLLKSSHVNYVLMHSRGIPSNMQALTEYGDVLKELELFFDQKIRLLQEAGVSKERIVLDPGIGFAKMAQHNLKILSSLERFKKWGCPLMIGVSRKSFLKEIFGNENLKTGTELAHLLALQKGVHFLRVHDVRSAKQTLKFFESFQNDLIQEAEINYGT